MKIAPPDRPGRYFFLMWASFLSCALVSVVNVIVQEYYDQIVEALILGGFLLGVLVWIVASASMKVVGKVMPIRKHNLTPLVAAAILCSLLLNGCDTLILIGIDEVENELDYYELETLMGLFFFYFLTKNLPMAVLAFGFAAIFCRLAKVEIFPKPTP